LSFETSFSFSLASVIFKGIRHPSLRGSAETALRTLLRITVQTNHQADDISDGSLLPDALGYFLALIPFSTTPKTYERLVQECHVSGLDMAHEAAVPRVSLHFIGLDDSSTALLLASFVSAMLMTAQGDDAETQMLYTLLSDVATVFPDVVSMAYVFHLVLCNQFLSPSDLTDTMFSKTKSRTPSQILPIPTSSRPSLASSASLYRTPSAWVRFEAQLLHWGQ
jgi:hypothetical protein